MRKRNILITILLVIIVILSTTLGYLVYLNFFNQEQVVSVNIEDNSISPAVEKVYDAVVVVESYQNNRLIGSGTGFVYKKSGQNGYILTNNHVITNADRINIIFSNNEHVEATLRGSDLFLDVAVLTVPADQVLKVANIGSSEKSRLGDTVFTIGAPIGNDFSGTVTRGILSGKDRMVTVNVRNENIQIRAIQTDAAINPGNSGGPLLNINSEVIGINSLKIASSIIEGMGFAIPIEDVMKHIETLEAGEQIIRPFIGVMLLDLNETNALRQHDINIPNNIENGVVVAGITPNSPATDKLRAGDVITMIDNQEVNKKSELRFHLFRHNVGDTVTLTINRGGNIQSIDVVLGQAE